jgi:hypothetical protein
LSFREQQKYLDFLKKHQKEFERQEYDEYKIFVKRLKDDEDFDSISMRRLKELYDKYNKPVDLSKYDKYFKKSDDTNKGENDHT